MVQEEGGGEEGSGGFSHPCICPPSVYWGVLCMFKAVGVGGVGVGGRRSVSGCATTLNG